MNKNQKIITAVAVVLVVASLGMLIYYANANKAVPYDVQAGNITEGKDIEGKDNVDNVGETGTLKDKNVASEEKTLEEKEKEIESKKPKDKIVVDLLKDTSNATADDTLATLPDAPLFYKVDGIEYKLTENPEIIEKPTEELTENDIKRIQNYGYNWYTGYVDKVEPDVKYGEYYKKEPKDTEAVIKKYIPQRLDVFKNAMVGWATNPNLVYKTAAADYAVSGVLQLSYLREDNIFNLEPYKLYERDAEFRYANTTDGLFLRQIIYLSDWREVEEWGNPYE